MLQIVTKMYFREGVPLHTTIHRDVLYTNCLFLRQVPITLSIAEIGPSTGMAAVSSLAVAITEHLEAEELDGSRAAHVATGGTELFDDLADVMSFRLNAVCSGDFELVRRLVPRDRDGFTAATQLFRRTFDPSVFVAEAELAGLQAFVEQLLGLRRPHFEAALRSIKRVMSASRRAVEDPTVAYTDMVAALEALSGTEEPAAVAWEQMDSRRRALFDEALDEADPEMARRVRAAAIEADRLGAKNRFVQFVLGHVAPTFFRDEAMSAAGPIGAIELGRAVRTAYDIRSRNVHALWDLPAEAWLLGRSSETVSVGRLGSILSLQGLFRLARHVITDFITTALQDVDPEFNWRTALPGRLTLPAAPQYWIHNESAFGHVSAARYFAGLVGHLLSSRGSGDSGVPDMHGVLAQIEQQIGGLADGEAKLHVVAIYELWHRLLPEADHRDDSARLLERHGGALQPPTMVSFVVEILAGEIPPWTVDQWTALADARHTERGRERQRALPAQMDAAL
ncbi:MAG TPA: hypothetical protein VHV75_18790, partial [Solirubrobacteraceae bacterium]|nr:hypothetical protein [Solirubrobacteraceae bacterium]